MKGNCKYKNLACEMVRQDISRRQLAEKLQGKGLNVNYPAVCRWLNGATEPNVEQATTVAHILNKPIDYLFKTE